MSGLDSLAGDVAELARQRDAFRAEVLAKRSRASELRAEATRLLTDADALEREP